MDLLTHILTAYLLAYGLVGFRPAYLAAGALAGGLPDADILLYPLWKRFPILRHHGITHSLPGVTIIAVGGALLAPLIAGGSALVYFGLFFAGGALHILEDAFTNFSVPPLLPFSDRRLQLDADRAVNFVTLIVSALSFYLLLGVERDHVAFSIYLATLYGLAAFFVAYFAIRLAGRLRVGRLLKRIGPFDVVVATSNPLDWMLLSERKEGGRMTTVYGRFRLFRGLLEPPRSVSAPMEAVPGVSGPIADRADALARSYPLARKAFRFLDDTYHFADAEEGPRGWAVTWYSLEFALFGRAAGVRVSFDPAGAPTVRRAWYAPRPATPSA